MDVTIATLLIVMVLGGIVLGYSGFGFNLVTVPILALVISTADSVVLTLVVGALVSAWLASRSRALVHRKTVAILLAASTPGVIVGVWAASVVDDQTLKRAVGITVALSAVWLWMARIRRISTADVSRRGGLPVELGVGMLSGVMVAGAAMSGPPIVWMFAWRSLPPLAARATTLAYVAVVGLGSAIVLLARGVVAPTPMAVMFAWSLPASVMGMLLGTRLLKLAPEAYSKVAVLILFFSGASGVVLSLS